MVALRSKVDNPEEGSAVGEGVEGEGLVSVEAQEVESGALGELIGPYGRLAKSGSLGGVVVLAGFVRPVGELEVVGASVKFSVGVDIVGV